MPREKQTLLQRQEANLQKKKLQERIERNRKLKFLSLGLGAIALISSLAWIGSLKKTSPPPSEAPTPIVSNETPVQNYYSWNSPGGSIINFDARQFPGSFYPNAIESTLGPYCQKPLVVPEVNVTIIPHIGIADDGVNLYGVNHPAGLGVTQHTWIDASGRLEEIEVFIAGGRFLQLKGEGVYDYPSPAGNIPTTALPDMNGTIFEETAVHVCRRTTHQPIPPSENPESAIAHGKFLQNPVIMFKPQGWNGDR